MIRLKKFTARSWDVQDGLLVGSLTQVKGCEWYYTDLKTMVREPLDVATALVGDAFLALLKLFAVPATQRASLSEFKYEPMKRHRTKRAQEQLRGEWGYDKSDLGAE